MVSISEKYNLLARSNEKAIVLCNEHMMLEFKTYNEVREISKMITKMISDYVTERHICMGLLMNHNVYIPSIIVSLQNMKDAFLFLTSKNMSKTLGNLKLRWILSLEDTKEIGLFKQIHRLKLSEKNSLILWHRSSSESVSMNYKNIFCIVQTSGSTGECKTIRVPNICIEQNVSSLRILFEINPTDVIYWGTPLTFDPSIIELLLALQSGACLLIVPYIVSINPTALYETLFNVKQVTFLQMVPSIFLRWSESQIQNILQSPKLRNLAFGGEHFPDDVLRYSRSNHLKLFNLYGISEVSCWATAHEIKDETCHDEIPVGTCLTATSLELRDEQGKVVNVGKGEIFVGSSSRICYVNEERAENICGTVFRETGDMAEANEKGIFLIGRKNRIVKRLGHKVNLTRLETNIFKGTGLQNKCIWLKESNKILTFILIRNLGRHLKDKTLDKLRVKLINLLPEESFPDYIDIVENFPLTSHGKVDERALVKLYAIPSKTLKNGVVVFSQLWCKYFGISTESLDQLKTCKFFEMGGNSISAIQLLTEFKELVNCDYPQELVKMLFESTLQDCLNCLETFKPLRKRSRNITEKNVRKKGKIIDELNVIWSYDLKACVDTSPAVFEKDGSVYVSVGSFSHIFAIFNKSGEIIFKKILPDSIEGTPSISPCGNFILVGCFNGTMYCIDFIKKEIIWEYATGGKIKSSACFCRNQSAAVFGSYDKSVHCVLLETGLHLWQTLLDGSIASNPVYDEPNRKIFTASTSGTCICLNEETGELLWKYNGGSPIFGMPCLLNDNSIVFPAVHGSLHCLRSRTGEKLWTFQAGGHIFSSVIFYRDLLLFGCHDKNVYVTKVSPLSCDLVSKVALDSEISTTPSVCNISGNDSIVIACNSGIINVIDLETFSVLRSVKLPGEVFSSPCVYKDRIYVGCRDNNLYCIAVDIQKK